MGNSSSQTLKSYVRNNVNYQQSISATLRLQNTSTVNSSNINSFTLNNGGSVCCQFVDSHGNPTGKMFPGCNPADVDAQVNCDSLNISQKTSGTVSVVQSIDSEFAQQLTTQLTNQAQNDIANALNQLQQNDMFSGFGNSTKQEVENSITNDVNTTLNSSTVMKIVNSVVVNSGNVNKETINNCGIIKGNSCNMTQELSMNVVVQNILNSIADQVAESKEINDFYNKVHSKLSQTQQGIVGTLASIFTDLFNKLGKIGLIILCAIALIAFIMILVGVVFVFFKHHSDHDPESGMQ